MAIDPDLFERCAVLPRFVVAAKSRKVTGPLPTRSGPGWIPLGVRHGVPSGPDPRVTSREALCGVSISGWYVFATVGFTGASGADCRRCEQVMRADQPALAAGPAAGPT